MPALSLIVLLLGIAILDSVNPSALAMTFIQLSGKQRPVFNSLAYILGIFITYFALGVGLWVLYVYFGNSFQVSFTPIENFWNRPPTWSYFLQILLGLVSILYSLFYYHRKINKQSKPNHSQGKNSLVSSFILGITITGVEASTALPYFGAISTLYLADLSWIVNLVIILLYCLVFVLPPLIVVLIYVLFSASFTQKTSRLQSRFDRRAYPIVKYGLLGLGLWLVGDGIWYLLQEI